MTTSESSNVHYKGLTFLYLIGKKEGLSTQFEYEESIELAEGSWNHRELDDEWRLACRRRANDKDVSSGNYTPNAFHTWHIPYCPSHDTHPKPEIKQKEIKYKYKPTFWLIHNLRVPGMIAVSIKYNIKLHFMLGLN
jgi:hypothetical protein